MGGSWIGPGQWDKYRSEFGVPLCKLDGQGGEYEVGVAPVLEGGGTELIICKQPLCDRLRDRALSCPGQSVQPVDGGTAEVS